MRYLAFGDIHGMYDKLMDLWEKVRPTEEDQLIFLGDYIDRGPNSLTVVKFLKETAESGQYNIVLLKGNHESMLETAIQSRAQDDEDVWGYDGVLDALRGSMTYAERMDRMKTYTDFISLLKALHTMTINGETFWFVHAGIDPQKDMAHQEERDMLWIRDNFYNNYDGRYGTFVVGHTPVQRINGSTVPLILDNKIIMLDTGSFFYKVSCMDVATGEYWQA